MRNRIRLRVLGNYYTIHTDLEEPKIRKIETSLTDQLNTLRDGHPGMSSIDALILTSLNALEYIESLETTVEDLREQTAQYLAESKDAKALVSDLSRELSRAKNELNTIKFKLSKGDTNLF